MALAGAGAAHADDASAGKSARHASSPSAPTRTTTAASTKPTATATSVARSRVRTIPATPALAYVTHPARPLDPSDFGPVLGTIVRLANEIQYVITDQKPIVKPFQLPSAPNQSVIVGTLGAYTPNGDPYAATITTAPTNGTVAIDATSGAYVYTPNTTLATTGGTDTFTLTATDTANHPLADLLHLFGIGQHSTTATVTVNVAAATQPASENGDIAYYLTNTSYQNLQIAGYAVNQAALSPAIGQVIQSPATAANSELTQVLFEISNGKTVTVYLNPVGVIHEGVIQNYTTHEPLALAVSPDGSYLYSVDASNNSVSFINVSTGLTTATIPVGTFPDGIVATPDGSRLYVSNLTDSTVSVIDIAANLVVATIATAPGTNAGGIAVSPNGDYVYTVGAANGRNGSVSVISTNPTDPQYNTVTATIDVGNDPYAVYRVAVGVGGTRVYVSDSNAGQLKVIDTASNTVIATVTGITNAGAVAVSPDGARIYVANSLNSNGSVTVVNAATLAVEATIKLPADPSGMAVSPDGTRLYVTSYSSPVAIVDTDTTSAKYNTVISTVAVGDGALPVIFSPDGTTAYVGNFLSDTVSKIGVATSGSPTDGGTWGYVVTMTGGSTPTCSAGGSSQCPVADNSTILEDAPGTVYHIPSDQAQQQSDVLQNLVDDDMSNATFYTKSQPTVGYTNAMIATGFSPYANNTSNPSTSNFTATTTTSTASSSTWNVTQKVTEEEKMGNLTLKAEESASYTWGTTTTNTLTYTQTVTQTVDPGETLYLYTETPVYRFYGDWNVVYGNTTYYLENVWYDTPYAANSLYPSYIAAYTCKTGSAQCSQLASGDLSGYPNSFPTSAPTYPVAESDPDSSYSVASRSTLV